MSLPEPPKRTVEDETHVTHLDHLLSCYTYVTPISGEVMNTHVLAYLAGAMDSDGYFSIKRSTYHMRVRGDAVNPVYSEDTGLRQVTPHIPELLKEHFGGYLSVERPSTTNGKPLHSWRATAANAARCAEALLPYLRIKRRQAELMLELRESRKPGYGKAAYWFALEHPEWREMEMATNTEALAILGHTHRASLGQALSNGSILALPYDYSGRERGRFPRPMLEALAAIRGKDGRARNMPPQLVAWRERLWQEVRELNRIGTGLHPITERTGPYTPAAI